MAHQNGFRNIFVNNSIIFVRCFYLFLSIPTILLYHNGTYVLGLLFGENPFHSPKGNIFRCLVANGLGEEGVLLSSFLQENHFGHFAIVTHWKEEVECGCFEGRG